MQRLKCPFKHGKRSPLAVNPTDYDRCRPGSVGLNSRLTSNFPYNLRMRLTIGALLLAAILPLSSEAGPLKVVYGLQAAYGLENAIPRNISHINMAWAQPQIGIA